MTDIKHLDQLEHALKRPTVLLGPTGLFTETQMVIGFGRQIKALVGAPGVLEILASNPKVYGDEDIVVAYVEAEWSPGLLQTVKEVVNNVSDHVVRCAYLGKKDYPTLVSTAWREGRMVVANDGEGVPCKDMTIKGVRGGKDLTVPMPTGAFFEFNTSSNYDSDEEEARPWGGQNGKGAKLAGVFSTEFEVRTRGKRGTKLYDFSQRATRNLRDQEDWTMALFKEAPECPGMAPCEALLHGRPPREKGGFTCISWTPDLKALKSKRMEVGNPMIEATIRTVIWLAAFSSDNSMKGVRSKIQWFFNEEAVPSIKPAQLGALLFGIPASPGAAACAGASAGVAGVALPPVDKVQNEDESFVRLWVVVTPRVEGWPAPTNMGIVNGLWCPSGSVLDLVKHRVTEVIRGRIKEAKEMKPASIHSRLCVFYAAVVNAPTFGEQIKTHLKTPVDRLGFSYTPSKTVANKWSSRKGEIAQTIIAAVDDMTALKAARKARAARSGVTEILKSGGRRKKKVTVAKLTDAGFAGTSQWRKTTLVVTEGDSAAGGVLTAFDLDFTGVFPLKGCPLNLLTASKTKIAENKEWQSLMAVLGIEPIEKRDYTKGGDLRYGKLNAMVDQDNFGRKFVGFLIVNIMIWNPTVYAAYPDFFCGIMTPLIAVRPKGSRDRLKDARFFYTEAAYEAWKDGKDGTGEAPNLLRYDISFYKGLGVLSDEEMAFFCNRASSLLTYTLDPMEETKKVWADWLGDDADVRKEMFRAAGGTFGHDAVDYDAIFDGDRLLSVMKHVFGMDFPVNMLDSLSRNLLGADGLKSTQRKVLYAVLTASHTAKWSKSLHKVYEFLAFITGCAAYHHGEASLTTVFYNLADHLPNGINLGFMERGGNHGKIHNYKPAAARYAEVKTAPHVKTFFPDGDSAVLVRAFEDGRLGEPDLMLGVMPLAAINSNMGVASGWNARFTPRDPISVADATRKVVAFFEAALGEEALALETEISPLGVVTGNTIPLPSLTVPNSDPEAEAARTMALATLKRLQHEVFFDNWRGRVQVEHPPEGDAEGTTKYYTYGAFHWVGPAAVQVTEIPPGVCYDTWKTKAEKRTQVQEVQNKKVGRACATCIVRFDPAWAAGATEVDVVALLGLRAAVPNNPNILDRKTLPNGTTTESVEDYGDLVNVFTIFSRLRLETYAARKAYELKAIKRASLVARMRRLYIMGIIEGTLPDPRTVTKEGMKEAMDSHEPAFLTEEDLAPPALPAEVRLNTYLPPPVFPHKDRYAYILEVMKTTDLTIDGAQAQQEKDDAAVAQLEAAAAARITDSWAQELRAASIDMAKYLKRTRDLYEKEAASMPLIKAVKRKEPVQPPPAPKKAKRKAKAPGPSSPAGKVSISPGTESAISEAMSLLEAPTRKRRRTEKAP